MVERAGQETSYTRRAEWDSWDFYNFPYLASPLPLRTLTSPPGWSRSSSSSHASREVCGMGQRSNWRRGVPGGLWRFGDAGHNQNRKRKGLTSLLLRSVKPRATSRAKKKTALGLGTTARPWGAMWVVGQLQARGLLLGASVQEWQQS